MSGMNVGMNVKEILASYDSAAPLTEASTIPAPWYVDARIAELETQTVLAYLAGHGPRRSSGKPGQFVSATVAEAAVAVRGNDGVSARSISVPPPRAAVVTEPCGHASILHCPYHGWNYGLDGALKGMPEFDGVKNFERKDNGLVP